MNDMKLQYQELINNTVPKEKYINILIKYIKVQNVLSGLNLLIDNISKHINVNDTSNHSRVYILQEILNDAIRDTHE